MRKWPDDCKRPCNKARAVFDEFFRTAYACELDKGYKGPSGEAYILAEDIPAGHMTTATPMPPKVGRCKDVHHLLDPSFLELNGIE